MDTAAPHLLPQGARVQDGPRQPTQWCARWGPELHQLVTPLESWGHLGMCQSLGRQRWAPASGLTRPAPCLPCLCPQQAPEQPHVAFRTGEGVAEVSGGPQTLGGCFPGRELGSAHGKASVTADAHTSSFPRAPIAVCAFHFKHDSKSHRLQTSTRAHTHTQTLTWSVWKLKR